MSRARYIWETFCRTHRVGTLGVPLFSTNENLQVETFRYGKDHRLMLRRSESMRRLVTETVENVLSRPADRCDGMLYMMYRRDESEGIVPLYIGKAGRNGKKPGTISANLRDIRRNEGKFARWGYNYAYHLGDLSAVVLPDHPGPKRSPKYRKWGEALFAAFPERGPRLRAKVFFWCGAWDLRSESASIWREFGPCSLAFAEYLLIGVAGRAFPADLLNEEGVGTDREVWSK